MKPSINIPTNSKLRKKILKFGYWNVRTLYQTGKTSQVCCEMRKYGVDILGVSESRWTDSGKLFLSNDEMHIIYSGRNDNIHYAGVAIIMTKNAERALIGWQPVSERIISARFYTKHFKLTLINCYTPTNDSTDDQKDQFYNTLVDVINMTPRHDIIVVMGDFNAKVGFDNTGVEKYMGKHGLGDSMNQNGERLLELCETSNLALASTFFPHKNIHKITWHSPDNKTKNQIDHLCISRKFLSAVQDIRAFRGADINSDHKLCIAKINIKLRKQQKTIDHKKIDSQRLQSDSLKELYNTEIQTSLSASKNLNEQDGNVKENIETQWKCLQTAIIESAKNTVGFIQKEKKPWISNSTWSKIQERKQAKMNVLAARSTITQELNKQQYNFLEKEVKSNIKKDKHRYIENLTTEAENASKIGDSRTLFNIIKQLGNNPPRTNIPVKDKHGKTLISEEEQKLRWAEHFKELLNRPIITNTPTITEDNQMPLLNTSCENITLEEIKSTIKNLKNHKATGDDGISGEMLKAADDTSLNHLLYLFNQIWQNESPPQQWKNGIIVKLPKKGDLSDCNNWRGITLLSIPGKVFLSILLQRLRNAIDETLREEQAGFRPHRSTIDHIYTLRTIIEESTERQSKLMINFVDFQKAFDSLHRPSLWKILTLYGIPTKYINIMKAFYADTACCVRTESGLSSWFQVTTGVKQGCVLSPILFCIAIDWVMKKCTDQKQLGINWVNNKTLEDLTFADDIALLSSTHQDLQEKTERLKFFAQQIGLQINTHKTKIMNFTGLTESIKLDDNILDNVSNFVYLGSKITADGDTNSEIKTRIALASNAFNKLSNIWRSKIASKHIKLRLFNASVIPLLTYGCESWKSTAIVDKKLVAFENRCLRKITNTNWKDFKSNDILREETKQEYVTNIIRKRRWSYIGHILRMKENRIPRQAFMWTPDGKRKQGRPKTTLRRTFTNELKSTGINAQDLQSLATDRQAWRTMTSALCAKLGKRGTD